MTQTNVIQDTKAGLKRKESMDKLTKEQQKKKKKDTNFNELPDDLPLLKEKSRTSGVISRLETQFEEGETLAAYLCSPSTDHLATGIMDVGWGCGYRNCQMLMTFLEKQTKEGKPLLKHVLDIQGIQLLLERAWKEGFDALGAAQLDHHVFKTRKWIGTTEVYTLFTYLGIRSTIIDFHHPGPKQLHHDLMDWIQTYFMESNVKKDKTKTVYITNRPPLYLQHQGHSRTVVGIEVLKSGKRNLIMFDPGRRMLRSYKKPLEDSNNNKSEKWISKMKPAAHFPSILLRPFRVDGKSIGKHKQYQILVLGHVNCEHGKMSWDPDKGFLLDEKEREKMKNVTSLTVM